MPPTPALRSGPRLIRTGDIFILHLGHGENRFTPSFLVELQACVAEVREAPPPRSLVTTAGGKFFSTGLDLDWIAEHPQRARTLVQVLQDVLASVLTCSAYTVAAVQGHAFAGGALLALAHDAVVMRADRGYFCLPEIDLPVALTDGMTALVASKLPPSTATEAILTGRRYSADEAVRGGIAHRAIAAPDLLSEAIAVAAEQSSKDPIALGTMKERLFGETSTQLRHLGTDLPHAFPGYRNEDR